MSMCTASPKSRPRSGLFRENIRLWAKPMSWMMFRLNRKSAIPAKSSREFAGRVQNGVAGHQRHPRLPQVPRSAFGVIAVSAEVMRMRSTDTPSSSAAI